jgi:hypothetical protein
MSAIGRVLAYLMAPLDDTNHAPLLKISRESAPRASTNPQRTKGRSFASQKSRANRRKAGMKARVRR